MNTYEIYLCRSGTQSIFDAGVPVALARYDDHVGGIAEETAVTLDISATSDHQIWIVTTTDDAIRIDFENTVTATSGWLIPAGHTREFGSNIGQQPSVMLAA